MAIAVATLIGVMGCGFGVYDDSGKPDPGQWYPWICPDGTTPSPDAGCPVPPCPTDGGPDGDAGCTLDGGTDAGR